MPTIEQLAERLLKMSPSFQKKTAKAAKKIAVAKAASGADAQNTPIKPGYREPVLTLGATSNEGKPTHNSIRNIRAELKQRARDLKREEKMAAQFARSAERAAIREARINAPLTKAQLHHRALRIYCASEASRIITTIMDAEAAGPKAIQSLSGDTRVIYFALKDAQRMGIYIPFLYDAKNDPFFESIRLKAAALLNAESVRKTAEEVSALSFTERKEIESIVTQLLQLPIGKEILKVLTANQKSKSKSKEK